MTGSASSSPYKFTNNFEIEVLRKRPCLEKSWAVRILESPEEVERPDDDRYRFWGREGKTSYVLCHQPKSFDWHVRKAAPHPARTLNTESFEGLHCAQPDCAVGMSRAICL